MSTTVTNCLIRSVLKCTSSVGYKWCFSDSSTACSWAHTLKLETVNVVSPRRTLTPACFLCLSTALNEELKVKLEKRRASQDWPAREGARSSVPNPFSPQLCTHLVPSRWKTRDYKYRHFLKGRYRMLLVWLFLVFATWLMIKDWLVNTGFGS